MRAGRSEKNGATSQAMLKPRVDVAHARQILVARLLREQQARAQRGVEQFDRRRHDLRHDARALAAAEHQQANEPVGPGGANGVAAAAITAGRTGLPVRVALAASSGASRSTPSNDVAIAVTCGASWRLARPITALASWMTVGISACVAAPTGGNVG